MSMQEGDSGSQDEGLQELVQQFDSELNASDYINADEDLPTCDTYDNDENWRDELLNEVLSAKKHTFSKNDSEEEDESDEESPSTITTFREAIDW